MKKLNYIQTLFYIFLLSGTYAQELIIPGDVTATAQTGFIELSWNPIIASEFESYNTTTISFVIASQSHPNRKAQLVHTRFNND